MVGMALLTITKTKKMLKVIDLLKQEEAGKCQPLSKAGNV